MPAYSRKILGITVAFLALFVKTKVNKHDSTHSVVGVHIPG